MDRHPPGHRAHRGAGTGLDAAGHDHRLRRLATPPRMAPSARSPSASARARSSMCSPRRRCLMPKSKNMRVTVEGALPLGVTAKDMALAIIAQDRHRRRHGLRHRICGRRGPRAFDGRPHDVLQHDDRSRRARGPDRAGRDDLRLCRGPAARAERRRRSKAPRQYWAHAQIRRRREVRRGNRDSTRRAIRRWSPGARARSRRCRSPARVPDPEAAADENQRAADRARARLYGSDAAARR